MKIALMAGANCIHTARWANGLARNGIQTYLISAHAIAHELDSRVNTTILRHKTPFGYLANYGELNRVLKHIKPDLFNVHYATGYGFLARLVDFEPTLLSIWGSDIYEFPEKSFLHRRFLEKNLRFATAIASTSYCMQRKATDIYPHDRFYITPFGVDENMFCPVELKKNSHKIHIGTVKTLKDKYGIDTLIRAFALVMKNFECSQNLILDIVGSGPDLGKLKHLATELSVEKYINFLGPVSHEQVPKILNRLDIFIALSRIESFGVSILEASSCGKPVVVSDADGPAEVTLDGITGFVVPKNDPLEAANAILKLLRDPILRGRMGDAGRHHVLEKYTWDESLKNMIAAYQDILTYNSKPRVGPCFKDIEDHTGFGQQESFADS
jgi:glycosyltransferase involved in cell wall biosynthesis